MRAHGVRAGIEGAEPGAAEERTGARLSRVALKRATGQRRAGRPVRLSAVVLQIPEP